ncbi:MAG: hypothetical protein ABL890_04625 [Candidatus Peribacteraceae bacterium]
MLGSVLPALKTALQGNQLRRISSDLSGAMSKGLSPQDPGVQKIVRELLSRVGIKGDIRKAIDRLDSLIPDSFERKFGITPQMKTFVKSALGSSTNVAALSKQSTTGAV